MSATGCLYAFAAAGLAMPERLSMHDWCCANITIPGETGTPWPGQYSTEHTPWVRGWFDIIADPGTRLFAVKKGAQVAFTQTVMCACYFWQVNDPGNTLYVMDSLDMARRTSRVRIQPVILASPKLKAELKGKPDDALMNVFYSFKNSNLTFVGANSAGQASSFTYRRLILEEPEKYKDTVGSEGNTIENLMERTKRAYDSKILIGCTPTNESGYIEKYVKYGDRLMYFVPCPACGMMQVIVYSREHASDADADADTDAAIPMMQVVYDRELSPIEAGRAAHLECENKECRHAVTEQERRRIVDAGEWRPTKKPQFTGYRSAEISGLYGKDDASSPRAIVEKMQGIRQRIDLGDMKALSDLQVFVNSTLGQVWKTKAAKSPEWKAIWQFRDMHKYRRGTIPHGGDFRLALNIDVQEHFIPWAVYAHAPRDLYLVDHGRVTTLEELDALIDRVWTTTDLRPIKIGGFIIDTGYKAKEVYEWVRVTMGKVQWVIPVKGDAGSATQSELISKPKQQAAFPWIWLFHLHPLQWHVAACDAMAKLEPKDGETLEQAWTRRPFRLHLHEDIDSAFVAEITAEVVIDDVREKSGEVIRTTKKLRRDNHQFDLFRYALVCRFMMRDALAEIAEKEKTEGPEPAKNELPKEGAKEKTAADDRVSYPMPEITGPDEQDDAWNNG